jgi:flagellar biosynthetic protein FliP
LPYSHGKLNQAQMISNGVVPLREFMLRQTHRKDLELFEHIAHEPINAPVAAIPLSVVMPAFVVGELRNAFAPSAGRSSRTSGCRTARPCAADSSKART